MCNSKGFLDWLTSNLFIKQEEVTKKRTRRAVKFQRAITGASLAEIMAKRNQKPEVRKAQREQAIR